MKVVTNQTVNTVRSGTLLTLAFFIAKITGYINWSWFWVFAPLWLPVAIILSLLGGVALFAGACGIASAFLERKRR